MLLELNQSNSPSPAPESSGPLKKYLTSSEKLNQNF